jgi:uncharacterized protein YoxC
MAMEILLVITLIAVAASVLYVAATLKLRIEKNATPLVDNAAETIRREITSSGGELGKQLQAITKELPQDREQLLKHINTTSAGLTQQLQAITGQAGQNRELLKHLEEQISTRQNQYAEDLHGLDHRVAQLHESVDRQSSQVTAMFSYTKRQEKKAESSSEIDPLVLAMLEAESLMESQGWGKPPRLYALTEKNTEIRDGGPPALIPAEQEPIPDDNLIAALAGTRWPEDVVGCVLVTELTDLPPWDREGAFADPLAAGQWASTHPDGRPARLAVGVSRNGEHACGLRIKGEDDIQIRTELAEGLVTVLLGTF